MSIGATPWYVQALITAVLLALALGFLRLGARLLRHLGRAPWPLRLGRLAVAFGLLGLAAYVGWVAVASAVEWW